MDTKYKLESMFETEQGSWVRTVKEFNADNLSDVIQEFREFLLGCGFSPKIVDEYFEGE